MRVLVSGERDVFSGKAVCVSVLRGKLIVLAVSGSISAYKAADIASKLIQAGAGVEVILSDAATRFVGVATFEALTRRPVHTDLFAPWRDAYAGHVTIAQAADAIIVAPATAQTIARLAMGFADDMLGSVALSSRAPVILAPAMEHGMYHHPATQANIDTLRARGVRVVGPDPGRLASGASGDGRLAPVDEIVGAVRVATGANGPLRGLRVVVSTGGTQEPLDPIRYLGNRSSGRMGAAVAQAALDRGAEVTLIAGATSTPLPFGAEILRVGTAAEMALAVHKAVATADALVMAAAVADFAPQRVEPNKIKKQEGVQGLTIELAKTADIVGSIDRPGLIKIGFAAETEGHLDQALVKCRRKNLTMIVANDAVETIGSANATATFVTPDGRFEPQPPLTKEELADRIVDRLGGWLGRGQHVS